MNKFQTRRRQNDRWSLAVYGLLVVGVLSLSGCLRAAGGPPMEGAAAPEASRDESAQGGENGAWARALLEAFRTGNEQHQRIMKMYCQALGARAGSARAAVLTSLGDYMCGPLAGPFQSAVEKKVVQSIRRGSADIQAYTTEVWDGVLWRGGALCYLAACAEKPRSGRAWMRLSLLAEEASIRHGALARWRKVDPENGLAYYLCAGEQAQRGSLVRALCLVQEGNQRGKCEKHRAPYPVDANILYPATEPFDQYSIVGIKVPEPVLVYAAHLRQLWFDGRMRSQLRELARVLTREGSQIWESGDVARAREYYYASLSMGLNLIHTRPHDLLDVLTGVTIYKLAGGRLLATFKDERTSKQKKAVLEYGRHVDSLKDACCKFIEEDEALTERRRMKMLFRGELLPADQRAALEKAIRALPQFPELTIPRGNSRGASRP